VVLLSKVTDCHLDWFSEVAEITSASALGLVGIFPVMFLLEFLSLLWKCFLLAFFQK
jgi:hypothetical protein